MRVCDVCMKVVLGERKVRPAVIDQELAKAIQSSQSDARFQTVLGGTMCTDDFFEGQPLNLTPIDCNMSKQSKSNLLLDSNMGP